MRPKKGADKTPKQGTWTEDVVYIQSKEGFSRRPTIDLYVEGPIAQLPDGPIVCRGEQMDNLSGGGFKVLTGQQK